MPRKPIASKAIGLIVGLVVMAAAVYSVFFIEWDTKVPSEPTLVRPLKTMVIESPFSTSGGRYPGKVRANEEVNLAFQVAGQLIEFPVIKGEEVPLDKLLGRLDPRDFENALAAEQAKLDRDEEEFKRIKKLAEGDHATEKELYEARAAYDASVANVNIARKAFDDTHLRAPFAGVIADTYVDNFQNIGAKQPILSLQEIKHLEIVVNVPEERVIRAVRRDGQRNPREQGEREKERYRFVATFEYLPGREFDVEFKEFATEADHATQTYAATFVIPTPTDVTILPGMTATIREYQKKPDNTEPVAYAVPVDAVPIDGQGNYFVWTVRGAGGDTGTVHRVFVQVGEMVGNDILVLAGLKPGDRIALAGVHLLQEGQQVRPFSANGDAKP